MDVGRLGALGLESGGGFGFHAVSDRPGLSQSRAVQRPIDPGLTRGPQAGVADPPGGEDAGVGRAENLLDAEGVGHLAGDLPGRAPERHHGMVPRVEAALSGDRGDGGGDLLHGDGEETLGGGFRVGDAHGLGQFGEPGAGGKDVERLVAGRAEHSGKVRRIDPAQYDVGVGDGGWAAQTIGGGTGFGPGAFRPDPGAQPVEAEDGAPAGGHGLHVQHRRPDAHARHGRRGFALQGPGEAADVGGRAAHVEAEDGAGAGFRGHPRHPDRAPGGAGQDGVPALERSRSREAARGGHEVERRAAGLGREAVDVGLESRRQIGVGDGGLSPGQEAG